MQLLVEREDLLSYESIKTHSQMIMLDGWGVDHI